MRPATALPLALVLLGIVAGCGAAPPRAAEVGRAPARPDPLVLSGRPMIATELFLGTRIGTGGELVPAERWRAFLDEVVMPAFPDGLTVFEATGRWRMASGTVVAEPTHVLLIVHDGAPRALAAIEEIAVQWKLRFRQEAVLRLDQRAGARF